MTELETVTKAK